MKKNSKLILKFTIKPKVILDSSFIDKVIDKPVESTILEEPRIVTTPTNIDSEQVGIDDLGGAGASKIVDSPSPKLSYIPAPIQDFSPKGIIQMYYPGIIFELLTEEEVRETLQNILNMIEMKNMIDDVISPGLRPSEDNINEIPDFNL